MTYHPTREEREKHTRQHQEGFFKRHREKIAAMKAAAGPKPLFYERPSYNTPQYWRDCSKGWITNEEQQADAADFESRRKRARDSKYNKAPTPHRHSRPAPFESKQYCKEMSTRAARDDRLTPQAKALLQIIVARTGKGRSTDTTKTTLGAVMNRCPRSIQRYISELVKFDYIRTQIIKSLKTGFYTGLRIWIMNCVLPYYDQKNPDYEAKDWINLFENHRNSEETKKSPTKAKKLMLNIQRFRVQILIDQETI